MFLQRKALYNLIQLNLSRSGGEKVNANQLEPWQIENYRKLSTEELFHRLLELGISFSPEDFEAYSHQFESPEEVTESIAREMEIQQQDRIFLLIFELWRRLIFEKRPLSIFCDELDHQIMAHDLGKSGSLTDIQDALAYLQQIITDYADKGENPKSIFMTIQTYSAHDLESFIFDYILEQIESENYAYATELLEGFTPYMSDPFWFEYLSARAEMIRDPEEGFEHLEKTIDKVKNLDLVLEILSFLARTGNHSLFHALALKTASLLETEEDFIEFAETCQVHYRYLEITPALEAIKTILENRKARTLEQDHPISKDDPDLSQLNTILKQKLQFAIEG